MELHNPVLNRPILISFPVLCHPEIQFAKIIETFSNEDISDSSACLHKFGAGTIKIEMNI